MVSGDGDQYWLTLGVEGGSSASLAMGELDSGFYAITMVLEGRNITLSAQRTQDGLWLGSGGVWSASAAPALTLNDATYGQPGILMIGGDW